MRRRRVGNLMALAVLATVIQRPMHRYEMASIMRARGKDQDLQVKWGSLYTVVENMVRHDLLEVVGQSRQGARPERTVYRITDAGRQELVDWTRELISSPAPEHPQFAAGLSVMVALPPDEVAELLALRLAGLEQAVATQQAALAEQRALIPEVFLIENDYTLAVTRAEAEWVRTFLQRLEAGTYPGLEAWRAWHADGAVPPELRELSERGSIPT